mgnify:CR=1 FL=1
MDFLERARGASVVGVGARDEGMKEHESYHNLDVSDLIVQQCE